MTTHLLLNERPLQVLPSLAKLLGINAAIIVQQTHWVVEIKHENKDFRTEFDGFIWCKYSLNDWQEKLPWLTTEGIYKILRKLEADKIIISCKPESKSRNQTKWYRVDHKELDLLSPKPILYSVQNESLYSVQNESLYSVQNESLYSVQNDQYKKDSKYYKKKQKSDFLPIEQKKDNLSDGDNSKDLKTPPIAPPAAPPENSSKAIAISKQAERYQQFEARFSQPKHNRHVPRAFIDAGYAEWHNGSNPLDWRKSLIDVCIQRKKKRGDESTIGAATDFISNVISDCVKMGMWTKFQNLVDESLKLEQAQSQRSQQQQQTTPEPERETIAYSVPSFVKDFAAAKSKKAS